MDEDGDNDAEAELDGLTEVLELELGDTDADGESEALGEIEVDGDTEALGD